MIKNYKWLLLLSLGLVACSNDDDAVTEEPIVVTSGEADFSTFVALGNSLTAGFTDGALFKAAQMQSMPNLMAQKFALAGGGEFTQPLMNDNTGGLLFGGNPLPGFGPRLFFNGSGIATLPGTPTTDITSNPTGPFNNLGVPGAKSFHLLAPGYGNPAGLLTVPPTANPYFVRMASNPATSVIADAVAQNPTFFQLWIGNNDVLGYALSGGDGTNPITDTPTFTFAYNTLITQLTSGGAKGVVANVPNVTSIPHFTTVPYNPVPLDAATATTLNTIFGALNQIYAAIGQPNRSVVFSSTQTNAVVIKDESLANIAATITGALNANPNFPLFVQQLGLPAAAAPLVAQLLGSTYGQTRQATADDLLVLPSSSVIGTVNTNFMNFLMSQGLSQALAAQFSVEGVTFPLDDKWVLLPSEQQEIATATDTFNGIIESAAGQAGLAFVDANSLLQQVATTGIEFDEFTLRGNLIFGGAFGLDGVHPTARGYAFLANEFLKAIDETYGSNFAEARVLYQASDFNTLWSPQLPQ